MPVGDGVPECRVSGFGPLRRCPAWPRRPERVTGECRDTEPGAISSSVPGASQDRVHPRRLPPGAGRSLAPRLKIEPGREPGGARQRTAMFAAAPGAAGTERELTVPANPETRRTPGWCRRAALLSTPQPAAAVTIPVRVARRFRLSHALCAGYRTEEPDRAGTAFTELRRRRPLPVKAPSREPRGARPGEQICLWLRRGCWYTRPSFPDCRRPDCTDIAWLATEGLRP